MNEMVMKLDELGRPAWIGLMVVSFILVWPVGLAILAFLLWSGRMGCGSRMNKGRWPSGFADKMERTASAWSCALAIAPATCGYVAGAPAFVFANSIGNDVDTTCWNAASQLGSMAGLEPLFNCPDVMSYLAGCGPKSFRNESSACGTFQAGACFCGGSSRNSYAVMRDVFGATDPVFGNGFE